MSPCYCSSRFNVSDFSSLPLLPINQCGLVLTQLHSDSVPHLETVLACITLTNELAQSQPEVGAPSEQDQLHGHDHEPAEHPVGSSLQKERGLQACQTEVGGGT